ncbi:hypothetical protein DES53_107298 [Roseimicrobium gellanilyticum]|uniref:DUF488 domain-containing protein n=1 Tax=Roseimicrobium gellanilyticum TaxID=748857 RepID=A0A366HHS0_9BACT|nr:hypothetical protein DES53_107298 [Roseimicrobium gellanilyticum]
MAVDSSPNTVFSLGYWGWGNHTEKLVELIDGSEASLRFGKPVYVDIRLRKAVRAKGFQGARFAQTVGGGRYHHIPGLGNLSVRTGANSIRIKQPGDVKSLMQIVLAARKERRRVVLFCACEEPCWCHRRIISRLLVGHAIQERVHLTCVEWPGGSPEFHELEVSKVTFDTVWRGQGTIALSRKLNHLRVLPWYSVLRIKHGERIKDIFTGRAIYRKGWRLPYFQDVEDAPRRVQRIEARLLQHDWGYAPQSTY